MGSRTTLRFGASCKTSTVKKALPSPGWSPPSPVQKTSLILGHSLLVSNADSYVKHAHFNKASEAVWGLYVVRPRGGAAQKNGVPRVCVPRPVGILQVAEFSVPDHSNPAGKGLRLEPPRRRTGPYSQRVCQWQHLVTELHGGLESPCSQRPWLTALNLRTAKRTWAFKRTHVHVCNMMTIKMLFFLTFWIII